MPFSFFAPQVSVITFYLEFIYSEKLSSTTLGVFKSSYNDFTAHLKKIWFGLFDRGGGKDSSW